MRTLIRLAALLKKELIQLLKNPKMRAALFVPPMMQLLMLGYAATLDLKSVDFAVLDYAQCSESRELKSRFAGSPVFVARPDIDSESEMKRLIDNRLIKLAVVIPADFKRAMSGQTKPTVQVISDGRSANSSGIALAYAANIINNYSLSRQNGAGKINIQTRSWYNPTLNVQCFMVPALLAVIALIDIMLICSLSIAREREDGTFDQLRMTPFATWELLFAKGMSALFVGTCQLSVGIIFTFLWFRVPLYSSFGLLVMLLGSFLFASIGIGLLISTVSQNLQQALLGMFVLVVPFAMLSGMGTPLESMPDFFQSITIINPLRHGIAALPRIFLEGTTFWELRHSFFLLWAIGLTAFVIAYFIFNRQRQGA